MSLSFENKKSLITRITLGTDKFDDAGNNQITLEGFRTIVDIVKAGGKQMSTLHAKIYGVKQADMNAITTLAWRALTFIKNRIEVFAIDGVAQTLVFAGNIINAWGDYNAMPDVYLNIQASAVYFQRLRPVSPRSFKGQIDVASIMNQIALDMGLAFENNGVNVQLSDTYLANTNVTQAEDLAQAANIALYIDDKTLAIAPLNTPRGGAIPLISRDTGLIGYPTFDKVGVNFQILFNPAVQFGGSVKLETDLAQANGQWVITSMSHRLESEKPGGAWFTTLRGTVNELAISR